MTEAGWVMVPKGPTEQMLRAANKAALATSVLMDDTRFACERATYVAALAAAPPPSDEIIERMVKAQNAAIVAYRKAQDAKAPHYLQGGPGGYVFWQHGEEAVGMRAALAVPGETR